MKAFTPILFSNTMSMAYYAASVHADDVKIMHVEDALWRKVVCSSAYTLVKST